VYKKRFKEKGNRDYIRVIYKREKKEKKGIYKKKYKKRGLGNVYVRKVYKREKEEERVYIEKEI
jgi:hypothetical protein